MTAPPDSRPQWPQRLRQTAFTALHHVKKHTGVGIVCAVAYFDPGNWGVDLQAGSQFGYRLLFVVLLAGLFAVFLQVLASRLGCVTGLDLASHCRLLLHDRPRHKMLYRWLALYPLYALAEIAIISTDLAELLGSAIALCMIFPKLQLWHGVLLTAFDVVLILAFGDPLRGKPVRMFEFLIAGLVFAVLICMAIIISKVDVHWAHAFEGYVPSKYIFADGGLYVSVGILGATVMPHSLFLGSALATQDRVAFRAAPAPAASEKLSSSETLSSEDSSSRLTKSFPRHYLRRVWEYVAAWFRMPPRDKTVSPPKSHAERENNSLPFVKAHLYHGIFDIVSSLLGFAVLINSFILILAAAVFFKGHDSASSAPASLFDAYDLIRDVVGKAAAFMFALALLAAGQSSSIIATVAGQAVSEGFLQWRVSPVVRRLLTRLLAVIPSMCVAIAVGRPGIDALLVISQVILSIVLPFITFPLLYLTSSRKIMSVRKPRDEPNAEGSEPAVSPTQSLISTEDRIPAPTPALAAENAPEAQAQLESGHGGDEVVDFSSGKIATTIGWLIWLVVMSANMYVIVTLAMGKGG
ncbi:hypothetical protein HGRIS_008752 [Hohenbuehelia grisea]|uniref:Natural resistance-associated macrophage protein n=1 Tax=Hohenbuehelia grisea TaxID=104357 RepID=A0ABR3J8Z3_9AGAR